MGSFEGSFLSLLPAPPSAGAAGLVVPLLERDEHPSGLLQCLGAFPAPQAASSPRSAQAVRGRSPPLVNPPRNAPAGDFPGGCGARQKCCSGLGHIFTGGLEINPQSCC